MILQPGEETGEGAKAMLDDGLYSRFPKPTTAIAFHDAAALPAGVIGVTPGYALANVDSVDITVRGLGGHARATVAIAAPVFAATCSSAASTLGPRSLSRYSADRGPRTLLPRSSFDRYFPVRKPLARL